MSNQVEASPLLQEAHEKLGWPRAEEIFAPSGLATQLTAELADQKIGRALRSLTGDRHLRVGVLPSNANSTEAPLALVCEFSRPASPEALIEAQRLAWNFSRSLLLLTIEPTLIRKWSCYARPVDTEDDSRSATDWLESGQSPQILPPIQFDTGTQTFKDIHEAFALSWIDLLSGKFFEREAESFKSEERADFLLLENLKSVRQHLRELSLADTWSHDLLARIIFVQFLFDRKDAQNRAALNPQKLEELRENGVLQGSYASLAGLLTSYDDTYALFRWLNDRFNGDLFPGKGQTAQEREAEWKAEQDNVRPQHLQRLSQFVEGRLEIRRGQYCLWKQYAFDAVPLDLISSIYEEFVTDAVSAHYTPSHVVDLMLDRVLPWEGEEWNLKVLDPSCGSGIFLVKSYQRLICRWKAAHRAQNDAGTEISPRALREILENNLFGVDKHPNAIRVASFSLYLAMCDEIDPRHYWSDEDRVSFPPLRDKTLVNADFFEEKSGFRTKEEAEIYDLVIGNPPWGDTTMNTAAIGWAKDHKWEVANKDFGFLFMAKSMALTKPDGFVCMIQSASALLYNRSEPAKLLQERVFQDWKRVDCVVNLAAFALQKLIKNVKIPICILSFQNCEADGGAFWYECPKPFYSDEDKSRIMVDFSQMHEVFPRELAQEPWLWSALMWGGARDRALLRKMQVYPCIEKLKELELVKRREGLNRGNQQKERPELVGCHILEGEDFPLSNRLILKAETLPLNQNPWIDAHASTHLDAFELPQLIVKRSWLKAKKRFQARIVKTEGAQGILCSKSYDSAHIPDHLEGVLEAAAATYNSLWANYFLFLTSGSFAFERPKPLAVEIRSLPLPLVQTEGVFHAKNAESFRALLEVDVADEAVSIAAIDDAVYAAFGFQQSERILIEDLVAYPLTEFKWREKSETRRATRRGLQGEVEPDLQPYCETLLRVLATAYGADKAIGARIWSESGSEKNERLPMRYISLVFGSPSVRGVSVEPLENLALRERIRSLYRHIEEQGERDGYGRQVREYTDDIENGERMLVLNLLKPDWLRYWTRSVALRDADEIARDFWSLAQAQLSTVLDDAAF